MTAEEFLKTEANPDDVIAITCNDDWDLAHLENLMEDYHRYKLKIMNRPKGEQPCDSFLPDSTISSATICEYCGREKWEHRGTT